MTSARFAILVLVGVLIVLAPLAHASPPDQSWLGGFYDDGDSDDVVLLVTWALHAVQGPPSAEMVLVTEVVTLVPAMPAAGPHAVAWLLEAPRAPPVA